MSGFSVKPFAIFGCAALLLSLFFLTLNVDPQSPDTQAAKGDPILGERIAGGIVFEGKLWLRGIGGGLISLSLADGSRRVHFERGVIDIKKVGHDLCILRWPSPGPRDVVLSAWRQDRFEDLARFSPSKKDEPLALVNSGSDSVVLSVHAIRIFSAEKHAWRQVRLKGKLRGGFQQTADSPTSGDRVYVGFNTGEWGGGLQRVDLRTGVISDVERRDTKELCAGPLNSSCDPVTGVIPDPQNKDCILAAVGLVHMLEHGRILRVCGKDVSLVFEKTYTVDILKSDKWEMTRAFFGLVPTVDGGFWGITSEALYIFAADGTKKQKYALPKLKPVSGIYLSRDLPGVVVVRTDANWAVSVSGYTPLLIPQEGVRLESQ